MHNFVQHKLVQLWSWVQNLFCNEVKQIIPRSNLIFDATSDLEKKMQVFLFKNWIIYKNQSVCIKHTKVIFLEI